MKELKAFTDEQGMIGHKSPNGMLDDFGDSPQRTFSYFIYQYLEGADRDKLKFEFLKIVKLLQIVVHGKIQYRRHWRQGMWTAEPWGFSRDQFTPMWIAASLIAPEQAEIMGDILAKRWGWAFNYKNIWPKPDEEPNLPDWVSPVFRLMMRTRVKGGSRLILELCDLEIILMSLVLYFRAKKDASNTSDDLNFQLHAIYALTVRPTWSARIARWLYRFRQKPKGYEMYPVAEAVQRSYFAPAGAPPMYLAAKKALQILSPA